MSKTPISPQRARMIEDMSVRKFSEKTRNDYIRHVKTFSTFLGRSPATATPEDLRRYQVHQSKEGVTPATIRVIQVLLGHAKLETTAIYTTVALKVLRSVTSPLDLLTPLRPKADPPK